MLHNQNLFNVMVYSHDNIQFLQLVDELVQDISLNGRELCSCCRNVHHFCLFNLVANAIPCCTTAKSPGSVVNCKSLPLSSSSTSTTSSAPSSIPSVSASSRLDPVFKVVKITPFLSNMLPTPFS